MGFNADYDWEVFVLALLAFVLFWAGHHLDAIFTWLPDWIPTGGIVYDKIGGTADEDKMHNNAPRNLETTGAFVAYALLFVSIHYMETPLVDNSSVSRNSFRAWGYTSLAVATFSHLVPGHTCTHTHPEIRPLSRTLCDLLLMAAWVAFSIFYSYEKADTYAALGYVSGPLFALSHLFTQHTRYQEDWKFKVTRLVAALGSTVSCVFAIIAMSRRPQ